MKSLALDIGSSTIKGAVLDLDRNHIHSPVTRPFPGSLSWLPSGWFEVSPSEIEAEVRHVLAQLLVEAPDAASLLCSGQMGGVILVDPDGAPLTNYLSWRDQRTEEPRGTGSYLDAIRARWSGSELPEVGNELQSGSVSSLLYWLAEHGQLPSAAMPATVADFVIGRLCHAPPQMHPTQAIGLLDLRAGTWHQAALETLGLRCRWPQLADERRPVGKMRVGGSSLACLASFGDQQCALRGVGLMKSELSLNISTGSQISRRTAAFVPGPYQTRCYFDGDYLNTITHLPAGRSLNVLCDLLTELARAGGAALANPWPYIAEHAATADGGDLRVDLAFFAGPLGRSGHLQGITTENLNVGNLFHAAFRAMADNYVRCADRLCRDRTGLSLALSGGLTRSVPILRQLLQDRFALPLRESATAEETLLGLLEIARNIHSR